MKGIPVYHPSAPGGKEQPHFPLSQPLPPAAASSWRQRQRRPLGEGSCPEISWRRQTAQFPSRKQKEAQKAALREEFSPEGPVLGPGQGSVCKCPGCVDGRGGLGSHGGWFRIHPLLFWFPDAFVQNPWGTPSQAKGWGVGTTQRRSLGQLPSF